MLKRAISVVGSLLLCVIPLSAGAAKAILPSGSDVEWNLLEDGSLEATETVVFEFQGGPFTYVYRDLPADYSDGIWGIEGQPGWAAHAGRLTGWPGGDRLGQPHHITWHFAPPQTPPIRSNSSTAPRVWSDPKLTRTCSGGTHCRPNTSTRSNPRPCASPIRPAFNPSDRPRCAGQRQVSQGSRPGDLERTASGQTHR